MLLVLSLVPAVNQKFNELIDGKSQTNRDQKSNLLFFQRHNHSQKIRIKLVKNQQKTLQRHSYYIHKNGNKYLIFDESVNEKKGLLKTCRCLGWN